MKKRFLIFLKSVHFILFLFAIGLTTVLFLFSDFPIEKYVIEENPFLVGLPINRKQCFVDLDFDGNSELFFMENFEKGNIRSKSKIKVMDSEGKLIDEWNFPANTIKQSPEIVSTHDFNKNNVKEVYVFTVEHDSLFLWSFEHTNRHSFLIDRLFILKRDFSILNNKNSDWDLFLSTGFGDVNNDLSDDMLLVVQTGYGVLPRRLLLLDLKKRKIINQTKDAGNIGGSPYLLDIDQDGKKEIALKMMGSSGNVHFPTQFTDYSSWLMIFDTDLKFIFPPLEFPEMSSTVITQPVSINGNKLLVTYNYSGNYAIYPKVILFNPQWEKSAEKVYPVGKGIFAFQAEHLAEKPIVVIQQTGNVDFLDDQLNIISSHYLNFPPSVVSGDTRRADLNNNGKEELIIMSPEFLSLSIISDDYLSTTTVLTTDYKNKPHELYIGRNKNIGTFIVLVNEKEYLKITYSKNPYYYFSFFILTAVFLLFLFLLEFIFSIFQTFYMSRFSSDSSHSDIRGPLFVISLFGTIKTIYHIPLLKLFPFHHHFTLPDTQKIKLNPDMLTMIDEVRRNSTPIRNEISFNFNSESIKVNAIAFPVFGLVKFYPVCYAVKLILNPEWEEKNSLWSKTIQKLVHDIKTPVSTVQMNIQTLKWKIQDQYPEVFDSTTTEWGFIETELNRLKRLTKSFLKLNDLEKPNFQNVSLKEIIDEVHQHFSAYLNEHIKFITDLDPDHDLVVADSFQIQMIFQVLIENSIDAIKDSGIISVSTSLMENDADPKQEYLLIEVSDTGNGISKEDQKKIFEPHFTTKKEGSGLGLSIAKKIVEDHGGEIWVHSTENFATVFSFTLPLGKRL